MWVRTLSVFAFLLAISEAQEFSYDSQLCWTVGMWKSSDAMQIKYRKMIANLNKDRTLNAQENRVANFLNNNWKDLPDVRTEGIAQKVITKAKEFLGARWRIVAYLKGLVTALKPKLTAGKFKEIAESNKRQEIEEIINHWEEQDSYTTFESDQNYWSGAFCNRGCFDE